MLFFEAGGTYIYHGASEC